MSSFDHEVESAVMGVLTVPVLGDNFSYIVYDKVSLVGAAVDPVEPAKVMAAAKASGISIVLILTTHSHSDHDGGNVEIAALLPGVPVVGGFGDGVAAVTREVREGEVVAIGTSSLTTTVIETPCHTQVMPYTCNALVSLIATAP